MVSSSSGTGNNNSNNSMMEANRMEEFRNNLLLLLQCGYPEGLPMNQLKAEYKQYFMEDVAPELILPRGYKNNKHWDTLFQMKEFREDFTLFYMGTAVYIKAIRKRNFAEMKLIAQLAKHSHLNAVRAGEFRCACCPQEMWKTVARESANGPPPPQAVIPVSQVLNPPEMPQGPGGIQQHLHNLHHHGPGEDIVVKLEPHGIVTTNGDDEGRSHPPTAASSDGGIYSIVQQAAHGNHHKPANNSLVNGDTVHEPSGTGSNSRSNNTNTSDGFMLDHQLRVQEQSPQGQSLQAFASLLNSAGAQIPLSDAGSGNQPFYTFVIQNGEIKVMQIVSSADGTPAVTPAPNGDVPANITVVPQSNPSSTPKKSSGHKRSAPSEPPSTPASKSEPEIYICSMAGCGETFEIKQHLQNHERTCGMKKYPCSHPGCDRRFKNSKQRHAHMTSRHKGSENSFHCTVPSCAAVFKTPDRLKVHESRCRFKFEQFQLMDDEAEASIAASAALSGVNNNNNDTSVYTGGAVTPSNHSSVPNCTVEPQTPTEATAAAFNSLQAASLIPERMVVPNSASTVGVQGPSPVQVKLENGNPNNAQNMIQVVQQSHANSGGEFQGFSTVDLSKIKSEIMEH